MYPNHRGAQFSLQFHGVPPRGIRHPHYSEPQPASDGEEAADEDEEDNHDFGTDDSGSSQISIPGRPLDLDELYELHQDMRTAVPIHVHHLSEEIDGYLRLRSAQADGHNQFQSDEGSPLSQAPPSSDLAARLRDLGLGDIELSDAPDFGEQSDGQSDESPSSRSDGLSAFSETSSGHRLSHQDRSNLRRIAAERFEDDEEDLEEFFDEVPNPPQLQIVGQEKLMEFWPLGDSSFEIFICPITHDVMTDPVVTADGYTYERSAIAQWFELSRKSPITGQMLKHTDLIPNHSVRTLLKMLIDTSAERVCKAKEDETEARRPLQTSHPLVVRLRSSPKATLSRSSSVGPSPPSHPSPRLEESQQSCEELGASSSSVADHRQPVGLAAAQGESKTPVSASESASQSSAQLQFPQHSIVPPQVWPNAAEDPVISVGGGSSSTSSSGQASSARPQLCSAELSLRPPAPAHSVAHNASHSVAHVASGGSEDKGTLAPVASTPSEFLFAPSSGGAAVPDEFTF